MRHFTQQIITRIGQFLDQDLSGSALDLADPPDSSLGDLALACFPISKMLKKSPVEVANDLASRDWDLDWLDGVTATGPYLNFRVRRDLFSSEVLKMIGELGDHWGSTASGSGKTVIVEYSSPNIAKHLAVHHLRSTMLGQAMANIFHSAGYEVVRWNHLGDWGTGFGKLLAAWDLYVDVDNLDAPNLRDREDPVSDLNALYVKFSNDARDNPELDESAREWFRKLENGDSLARERWETIREVSMALFEKVYSRLGVQFDQVIGESFYEDAMQGVIDQLQTQELLVESDGAEVVSLGDDIPPMLIRKKDGATLYGTRDLASAIARHDMVQFDRCLYVVDAGQGLHFRQVFGVLKKLGYEWADQLEHAEFGVMRLNVDGEWKKGKTRGGQVVLLHEVLDQAVQLAADTVREKNPQIGDEELHQIAEAVGMGAVIFSDMKAARRKDVNFDLEKILSFDGETGPYLQYTHVRFASILRKAKDQGLSEGDGSGLLENEEMVLLKRLLRYPEVTDKAARTAEPSQLSQYLLDLASDFNSYYARHRVISEDLELSGHRLSLIRALKSTLGSGLKRLCIQPLERM
ncbi:arginine--tRNA ligase [bacterium TMED181]|nr:arginine--tRNA ligase [Planctomycetota bacterium]OUW47061.1 MAG: arginine--tRNA ligase [bacterium TMED181]